MSLRDAIQQAQAHVAQQTPDSEAATLYVVIDPLLREMGYSALEIKPEQPSSQFQRPDRTVLPGTTFEWYLEAKSWNVSLDDEKPIQQATNYAHSNNRRWVVLTNGQIWRIYDDHITDAPKNRLVAEARLDQTDLLEEFLLALSKDSMTSGKLIHFALKSRLAAMLTRSLRDENSETIKALSGVVSKQFGSYKITKHDVAAYFKDMQATPQPSSSTTTPKYINLSPNPPSVSGSTLVNGVVSGATERNLGELIAKAKHLATGLKPAQITFPDGTVKSVGSWRELPIEILLWIDKSNSLPVPFAGGRDGRYFVNHTDDHKNEKMRGARKIHLTNGVAYVELHRSALDILYRIGDVCNTTGVDPKSLRVSLSS